MCRVVAAVGINHQLLLLPISAQLFRSTILHNYWPAHDHGRGTILQYFSTVLHYLSQLPLRPPPSIYSNTRVSLDIQLIHNCGPVPSPHILILHILKRILCSRVPAATGSNTTHNNPIMLPPPPAPVININTTETVTILKCFPDHYCNVLPLLAFKNLHSRDFYRILSKAWSNIVHHGPHYQRLQQICNTAAAAPSNEFSLDRCNLMYIVDGEAGMPH